MLPGCYTVRMTFEDQEASAAVEVLEDPRFQVPMAAQRERLDFIMTVGQRQEVAAEAVDRLRDARRAVGRAVEQVQANRGATDSTAQELASAGDDLEEALIVVEELFTGDAMNFYTEGGAQRIQGFRASAGLREFRQHLQDSGFRLRSHFRR